MRADGGRASRGGGRGRYVHRDSNSYTNDWTCLHEGIRRVSATCTRNFAWMCVSARTRIVRHSRPFNPPIRRNRRDASATSARRAIIEKVSRKRVPPFAFQRETLQRFIRQLFASRPLTSYVPSVCIFNMISPRELEIGLITRTDIFGLSLN